MENAFDWTPEEKAMLGQETETHEWGTARGMDGWTETKTAFYMGVLRGLVFKRLLEQKSGHGQRKTLTLENETEWCEDASAMENAFDWTIEEYQQMGEAYVEDVRWNPGHYEEVLQRLVRLRLLEEREPKKEEAPTESSPLEYFENKDDRKEDASSSHNTYDWTPEEEAKLNRAFYGTGRGCGDGVGYDEVLRQVLQEREIRISRERELSKQHEDKKKEDAVDTTPSPAPETKDGSLFTSALYLGAIVLLVIAYMMAKHSVKGATFISVGVITSLIVRHLRRIQVKNEYKGQSLSFWITVVFGTIFASIIGSYGCMKLAETVSEVSGGGTTPWDLFTLVAVVMGGLFFCLWKSRDRVTGGRRKLLLVLLCLSVGAIVSQGLGSYFCVNRLQRDRWAKKSVLVGYKNVEQENVDFSDTRK